MLRVMVKALEDAEKNGQNNDSAKVAMACARCVAECFAGMVEFLDENAYTQLALMGDNFCESAITATIMIMKNTG